MCWIKVVKESQSHAQKLQYHENNDNMQLKHALDEQPKLTYKVINIL